MYKACKHIIEFFCLCFSVFCSSHSISKSSVEVNLSTWMISSVSSSPPQLVLQEGSLRLVYKLNELAVEAISRIGSPLWFNSFLFLAASHSCRFNSCFLRSLTLSSLAFSASASLSLGVFDCFFPRLRVGTQSKLKASPYFAASPETKWRPQIRSLSRTLFVFVSSRLMAAIQRFLFISCAFFVLLSLVCNDFGDGMEAYFMFSAALKTTSNNYTVRTILHASLWLFTLKGHKDGG